MQYAAAPTMTSMYATPGASMYMPGQTVAAAPAGYAQQRAYDGTVVQAVQASEAAELAAAGPAITYSTQAGGMGAQIAAQAQRELTAAGQFNIPPPMSLTQGLVPPQKVEAERLAYEKALNAQLDKQIKAVLAEAEIKKQMLEQTAKTQLAEADLQINEKLKMDALRVDQEAQTMLNGLKEAAITQQTTREEAAAIAVAEYSKKKALEDMSVKSYQLQKNWYDQETKLQAEYQAAMKKGAALGINAFQV